MSEKRLARDGSVLLAATLIVAVALGLLATAAGAAPCPTFGGSCGPIFAPIEPINPHP